MHNLRFIGAAFNRAQLLNDLISWIITYSAEVDAIGSLLLTLAIIYIYLKQQREISKQTETMKTQTEAIGAGFTPLLEVKNIESRDRHPRAETDSSHPDYIELDLANLGNEVARSIEIQYYVDCFNSNGESVSPLLEDTPFNISGTREPLEPAESPPVATEGNGGALGPNDSASFFAPVQFETSHPTISGPIRLPTCFKRLNEAEGDVEGVCVGLVIYYENLAREEYMLPIKSALRFSINKDFSSFAAAFNNRAGDCELKDVAPADVFGREGVLFQ